MEVLDSRQAAQPQLGGSSEGSRQASGQNIIDISHFGGINRSWSWGESCIGLTAAAVA